MRWLGLVGTGFAALIAGTGAFVITAAPSDLVERRLVNLVERQTGRTLTVSGGARFSFFPSAGVRLLGVKLSAPKGSKGRDLLAADELRVEVGLLPLLQRRLEIQRFVLSKPVLTLHAATDGSRNWDFAKEGERGEPSFRSAVADGEAAPPAPLNQVPVSAAAIAGLKLGDVRIEDGRLLIVDERLGRNLEFSAIRAELHQSGMSEPVSLKGTFTWAGTALPIAATIAKPLDLLEGRRSGLALTVGQAAEPGAALAPVTAKFDGDLSLAEVTSLSGRLQVEASSGAKALAFAGLTLPAAVAPTALDRLAVTARVGLAAGKLTLADATVRVGETKAKGTLTVDTTEAVPLLMGALAVRGLDVSSVLAADAPAAGSKKSAAAAPASGNVPIDLSALHTVAIDAKLDLADIRWRGALLDSAAASVTLRRGILKVKIKEAALLGGRGHASVSADATRPETRLEANGAFSGVAVRPLLKAAFDLDAIEGRGDVSMGALAIGRTRTAMMSGLLGQGRIAVEDGHIVGLDLGNMARTLKRGELTGWTTASTAQTEFSRLSGSVSITKGVARSQDLALEGPLVSGTALGSLDLTSGVVDAGVRPTVAVPLMGDGKATASGQVPALTIPLRVSGPISHPSFSPDLGALAQGVVADPAGALRALQALAPAVANPKLGQKPGKAAGDLASRIGSVLQKLGAPEAAEAEPLP